jgi:LysM repeat protein
MKKKYKLGDLMKNLRELLLGLFTALTSTVIVLGALSLSVAENMTAIVPERTAVAATEMVVATAPSALFSEKTLVIVPHTATPSGITTTGPISSPTSTCQTPQGWLAYTVQAGDTLDTLATSHQSTKTVLKEGNCLVSDSLLPNTVIYLPPSAPTATFTPQATLTPILCSAPPLGWTTYTIQSGDTLTSLSYRYQVSVPDLQRFNCLGSSYSITVGQRFFVPFRPTVVPTRPPLWTPWPTATIPPFKTATPFPTPTFDSNLAPLDLTLSNDSIIENQSAGTVIGIFTTADPNPGDSHTLTLLSSDGGPFALSGASLIATAPLNYEARSLYTIRVRTTDRGGKSLEKNFWITVIDVNEAPTSISISNSSVASGQPAGTVVGVLITSDPDNGDSHTYSLFGGETGPFTLQNNVLVTNTMLDASLKSSYNIMIRSVDRGGLWVDQQFYITVLPAQ